MKKTLPRFATLLAATAFALTPACTKESGDHDHDHDEHHENDGHKHGEEGHDDHADHKDDHAEHKDDHADHKDDHADHAGHKDGDEHDHGHDHDSIEAGPNGGRILHDVEPHVEFLVTEDRKVQISAVNDDGKVTPITTQTASLMGGSRTSPTKMKFTKEGDVLISDVAFPEGNDFPVVIQLKNSPEDKAATVKFNLNLAQCPTCKNKEYACTCEH